MPEIKIKKLQMLDLADFADLCDDEDGYYPQVLSSPNAFMRYSSYRENCYVAYEGAKLVGYIYGAVLCDTLYPQFLFIRKTHRKQGIGKKLMKTLEQNCGCTTALVYYNKDLSGYYQRQGYEIGTNLEVGMKQIGGEQHEA